MAADEEGEEPKEVELDAHSGGFLPPRVSLDTARRGMMLRQGGGHGEAQGEGEVTRGGGRR
jgi:hypothetical protein